MTKVKISLFALAFVFAAGVAIAGSDTIPQGWYQPDYTTGATPSPNPPASCTGVDDLCATHYNSAGIADDAVFLPQ